MDRIMEVEIDRANRELEIAQAQFDNAAPEYIDKAIYRLDRACRILDELYKIAKSHNCKIC